MQMRQCDSGARSQEIPVNVQIRQVTDVVTPFCLKADCVEQYLDQCVSVSKGLVMCSGTTSEVEARGVNWTAMAVMSGLTVTMTETPVKPQTAL